MTSDVRIDIAMRVGWRRMALEIATHDSPAWRERANFLIFADLSAYGMAGRWEQLWAEESKDDEFVLCCIPYFTYGIALGDTIRTQASAGKKYVVASVLEASGHRVVRLWLKNAIGEGRDRIRHFLAKHAPLHEWSSENLLAIDVPEREPSPELTVLLADASRMGIDAEWGD